MTKDYTASGQERRSTFKLVKRHITRISITFAAFLAFSAFCADVDCAEIEKAPKKIKFEISSTSLSVALRQYSQASGIALLFAPNIVKNRVGKPLVGDYTPKDGLELILSGTGLIIRQSKPGVILIVEGPLPSSPRTKPQRSLNNSRTDEPPVEVVVVGNGSTLRRASRPNLQIVDTLGVSEIGELQSGNIAEFLGKLPGVHLSYNDGELLQPRIRGLTHLQTLIDGKEVANAGYRSFQLADMPGDGVKSISVYKTASADQVEGSVGGLIDIKTDQSAVISFSGRGTALTTFDADIHKGTPRYSLLMRLPLTRDGRLGVSITYGKSEQLTSSNYTSNTYRQSATLFDVNENGALGDADDNLVAPNSISDVNLIRSSQRNSFVLNGVWSPNEKTQFVISYLRLALTERLKQNGMLINSPTTNGIEKSSQYSLDSSAKFVISGSYIGGSQSFINGKSFLNRNIDQISLTGKWQSSKVIMNGSIDFAVGNSTLDYRVLNATTPGVDWEFSKLEDAKRLNWVLQRSENATSEAMLLLGYDRTDQRLKSLGQTGSLDFSYMYNSGLIRTIQIGIRRAFRYSRSNILGKNELLFGYTSELSYSNIRREGEVPDVTNTHFLDENRLLQSYFQGQKIPIETSVNDYYSLSESTYAAYIRALYKAAWGGILIDGDVGVRAVQSRTKGSGFLRDFGALNIPSISRDIFVDYLPSATLLLDVGKGMRFRAAASKTLGRPSPEQLSASTQLDASTSSGMGGNASLKPFTSEGLDIGMDWYFLGSGYLSWAAFEKKLNGFFEMKTYQEQYAGQAFAITRPSNGGSARLYGLEIGYGQKYTGLPGKWAGLGTDINLTLLSSRKSGLSSKRGRKMTEIPKYVLNITAFYQRNPWYFRANYQANSSYFTNESVDYALDERELFGKYYFADASIQYELERNVRFFIYCLNIDVSKSRRYSTLGGLPHKDFTSPKSLQVGIKFTF